MTRGPTIVIGVVLASSAGAHAADRPRIESWGKPDVSFDQYRADSVECAKLGYFRDVSGDEPAKRFIRGFETADHLLNLPNIPGLAQNDSWADSVRRTQPDRQKRLLHGIQVADVERCLTAKGYRKFTLSPAEEKTLALYPKGSDGRRQYLHALAARPAS